MPPVGPLKEKTKKKNNKIMPFAATWTKLKMFILSEVSQKQKANTI